jgi:hypothetical protein
VEQGHPTGAGSEDGDGVLRRQRLVGPGLGVLAAEEDRAFNGSRTSGTGAVVFRSSTVEARSWLGSTADTKLIVSQQQDGTT